VKGRIKMKIAKYVSLAVYFVVCFALLILTMLQDKDESGASGTITGTSTNNFYNQNKGRTKEGRMKKWTIILGILFAILTVVTSTLYMI
jgi:preprotein translocase subunit SecG